MQDREEAIKDNKRHSDNKNKSTSHNVGGVEEKKVEIKGIKA